MPIVKRSEIRSIGTSAGSRSGWGTRTSNVASVHCATMTPSVPPSAAMRPLSVSSWRAMRARLAPIAARTAISRDLPGGARQQQVGDIGARDEQHAGDRPEQHQQRQPDPLCLPLLQPDDRNARLGVRVGVAGFELAREDVHARLRLLARDTVAQPGDDPEHDGAA